MKRLLLSAFIAIFFIAQPAESGSALQEIKKNAKVKKDHFIMLLVLPEKDPKNANSSEANFHLKSNYTFDFDMRVGGVNLIKKIENEVNTH